ncbi:na[+]/H[+] hydrogen exchanger 2 isoform X2 [Oratosquilla oratoria]|uniref:na[+]/H[+] hydrogen exchanger 2 isoform X2 n=1 Tax=Oratosquilla oratoria TaxID=337810 RepID=UPI003F76AA28
MPFVPPGLRPPSFVVPVLPCVTESPFPVVVLRVSLSVRAFSELKKSKIRERVESGKWQSLHLPTSGLPPSSLRFPPSSATMTVLPHRTFPLWRSSSVTMLLLTVGLLVLGVGGNTPPSPAPSQQVTRALAPVEPPLNTHRARMSPSGDTGCQVRSEPEDDMDYYPVVTIEFERVQTPFIIGLWIFCACLGKIGFHMTPKLGHMFPESCMLIVLGIVIGLLLFHTGAAHVSPLTADVFFIYMLPPIILDAGYFMPNRLFFDHLGTILVMAVIGTIWNCMTIGVSLWAINLTGLFGAPIPILHIFLFSALISAVDPVAVLAVFEEIHVEEVLYILVFGESLLNDGVTVVLYHMFEGFSKLGESNITGSDIGAGLVSFLLVAFGGTAIGVIWGFLTGLVTRFTNQTRVIEPLFVFVMSYLAYLNAEIFHFSGILSIAFCGITMKNYVESNISQKSHTTIKYAMKMLASSSETIIFMFLGVATVQNQHKWNTWFVVFTITFCSVYRVIGVWLLSMVCNRFRVKQIGFVEKFVMSYGGLRGAVAFALVLTIDKHHIPEQELFMTATIAMVYFTVFVQGITIKPLVQVLGVKKSQKIKLNMNERLHGRTMDHLMAGIEDIMGKHGNFYIRERFKHFNHKFVTPCLIREHRVAEPKILETYSQLKMQEAMEYMAKNGHTAHNIESFAALFRNATMNITPEVLQRSLEAEWNLDVGELEYKPTARDINDAKFHHLLSEDYKPVKRHRVSTYKRHAVSDEEVQTQKDVTHHNIYLHTRQIVSSMNKHNRKNKRSENGLTKGIGVDAFKTNGSAIRLKNDHLEEVVRDNPAYESDEDHGLCFSADHTDGPSPFQPEPKLVSRTGKREKTPTAAEAMLPWKRYSEEDTPTKARLVQRSVSLAPEEDESLAAPTIAEAVLPWKRPEDEEVCDLPLRQQEFPGWASNKEYVGFNSPSNTFLGGIGGEETRPNIRDIFGRRSSSSSMGSRRSSLKDNMPPPFNRRSSSSSIPSRRGSVKDGSPTSPTGNGNSFQELLTRRDSAFNEPSLLTTAIEEEKTRDTVIDMEQGRQRKDDTKL